jgi:REP element-mobilizing transposase RayT
MTRPRKELVSVSDTPYYHIVSRCVRRSFLCGNDPLTKKCYEHRRGWVEDRIRILSSVFAVEICAYAVMSNHLNIVIKLTPEKIQSWSNQEVAQRWMTLFKGPLLLQKWMVGESLSQAERATVGDILETYRGRLASLSWYMKCLNEPIARQANKEDDCTGHFFEARYKSQALLTEQSLLACMAYVDLNPIRAQMASTPEKSDHTSIKERIKPTFDINEAIKQQRELQALRHFDLPIKPLASFIDQNQSDAAIPFAYSEYLELVDTIGRIVRGDKRGLINSDRPPILQRLAMDSNQWLDCCTNFMVIYHRQLCRRRRIIKQSS